MARASAGDEHGSPPPGDEEPTNAAAASRPGALEAAVSRVLVSCPVCGLVQRLPGLGPGQRARCSRCAQRFDATRGRRNVWAAATAVSALIVFPLAVTLPILEIERFGARQSASVWSGSVGLLAEGALLTGLAVFACSILAPPLKLIGLLVLCRPPERLSDRGRARVLRALEHAGRWGMLDVVLVAVLVAALKLGDVVRVQPGPGAVAFTLVVVASLVAAALFDPRALWVRALPPPHHS